jgi:cytochrome c peroxidase
VQILLTSLPNSLLSEHPSPNPEYHDFAAVLALHAYELALLAPTPPEGSFDKEAAARGGMLFDGKAKCSTCHIPPIYVEPGWSMHTPQEIGVDDFQASRSPDGRYRTAPLKGLWTHMKGGFFHDGRFATLLDVVNHYNTNMNLGLTEPEKADLVGFLKSLPTREDVEQQFGIP